MVKNISFKTICFLLLLWVTSTFAQKNEGDSLSLIYNKKYSVGPSINASVVDFFSIGIIGRKFVSPISVAHVNIGFTPSISFIFTTTSAHPSFNSGMIFFIKEGKSWYSPLPFMIRERYIKRGIGFDIGFTNYTTKTRLFGNEVSKIQDYSLAIFYTREIFKLNKPGHSFNVDLGLRVHGFKMQIDKTGSSFWGGENSSENTFQVELDLVNKLYWNFYPKKKS